MRGSGTTFASLTCTVAWLRCGWYGTLDQFENIWLRTKRKDASGKVLGGSGGVCYVFFPLKLTSAQQRVLSKHGLS
nr:hypothetical protein [Streptomyces sp. NRRL F-5053]